MSRNSIRVNKVQDKGEIVIAVKTGPGQKTFSSLLVTSSSTDTLLTFIYLLLDYVLIRTHGSFTIQFQFSDLVSTGNAEEKMLTLPDKVNFWKLDRNNFRI